MEGAPGVTEFNCPVRQVPKGGGEGGKILPRMDTPLWAASGTQGRLLKGSGIQKGKGAGRHLRSVGLRQSAPFDVCRKPCHERRSHLGPERTQPGLDRS